ncbi:hypothetical protein, partial [Pseudomonas umsongensis]|uniref:hypothetical protein n=1 Tax=Pseudomonas umsongensis TaxID=198618 RepID=UPI001C4C1697
VVMMWPVFFWVKLATLQRKRDKEKGDQKKKGTDLYEKKGAEKGDRFILGKRGQIYIRVM